MMKTFAHFIAKKSVAWAVVIIVLAITAVSAVYANRVVQDDDVLAFLPKKNKDVASFYEVAERFGSLDVALVGIESDDVFTADFLGRLKTLTKHLNETNGLEYTLSITSVEDFAPDKERGGITTDYLVREIPENAEQEAAIREKVLSRDHVIGNLVSADGTAVMIYVFATPGAQPRDTAGKVRLLVEEQFPTEKKYWGGAPFISTYVYDVTQKDLKNLAPWACLAIALIVLLSFKDLLGTGLSLLTTLLGIVIPLGIMGFMGVHTNIVLGSMPVILFALGSAYGVHILTRFYALAASMPREDALRTALEDVGPSVLGSGLTTVAGLLSFVMMDIVPMRTFGIFTAIGLTIALALALTFIPAVLVISPMKGRTGPTLVWLSEAMARLSTWTQRQRLGVGVATGVIALVACFFATRVDSRLDTTAFFDADSPPAEADAFLQRHFGGSQFIQIQIKGDMTDPAVLREVQYLGDRLAQVDGVSSVTQIGAIVAQINEAMDDVRRIPDSPEKVRSLYTFLTGKRAVSQTVTDDRDVALIHVKVLPSRAAEVEVILQKVEQLTETLPENYVVVKANTADHPEADARRVELVADHIAALALVFGTQVTAPDKLREALRVGEGAPDTAEIEKSLVAFMKTEAFGVPLPGAGPQAIPAIAKAVTALGAPPEADAERKAWRATVPKAVAGALGKDVTDPSVDDAALSLEQNVADFWIQDRAKGLARQVIASAGLVVPEGPRGQRFQVFVGHALLDLKAPDVAVPQAGAPSQLHAMVTGLPVLYRGLSQSVFNNQWNSLWFALIAVIAMKALLFRSFWTGILSSIPTLLTLLVIYGGMGIVGLRLDVGTSMLASLIIGAGDDYAVQYLWSWSVSEKASLAKAAWAASIENGAGVWTNALMVATGFFVLTLGEARPLQNVGGLTACAMLAAAFSTFVMCPLLARRRHYAPTPQPVEESEAGEPASSPAVASSRRSRQSSPQ